MQQTFLSCVLILTNIVYCESPPRDLGEHAVPAARANYEEPNINEAAEQEIAYEDEPVEEVAQPAARSGGNNRSRSANASISWNASHRRSGNGTGKSPRPNFREKLAARRAAGAGV